MQNAGVQESQKHLAREWKALRLERESWEWERDHGEVEGEGKKGSGEREGILKLGGD